jgi:hypothetical protein
MCSLIERKEQERFEEILMTSIFRVSVAASVFSAFALSAFAQAAGSVTAATGDVGSVKVLRGAEIVSVQTGAELIDGDVVQTGSAGTATLTAYGCTVNLKALESVTVNAEFCKAVVAKLDASGVTVADATVAGGGGVGAALPLAALAVVGTGAALAAASSP